MTGDHYTIDELKGHLAELELAFSGGDEMLDQDKILLMYEDAIEQIEENQKTPGRLEIAARIVAAHVSLGQRDDKMIEQALTMADKLIAKEAG